jgi:hypothetical protein
MSVVPIEPDAPAVAAHSSAPIGALTAGHSRSSNGGAGIRAGSGRCQS